MTLALATVDDLLTRTNAIDTGGDIRPLLRESLVSASIQLRHILKYGDNWGEQSQLVDTFQIDLSTSKRLNHERFLTFRLNFGFINEDTNTVKLRYGLSPDELDNAADIDAQFLRIDKEKGVVKFDTYGFQDSFISVYRRRIPANYYQYLFRITYDCGLPTKGTEDGRVYDNVPDWLYESCLIKARELYQLTNPAKDVKAADISGNLAYLVESKIRIIPLGIDPLVD